MKCWFSKCRHCEANSSLDEAIFIARISMRDCFVVPSRNDDLSIEIFQCLKVSFQ